ncbi:MAG: Holliday junction branch migration protein RuvA [Erysipelotrichaceae bacterium]|nr:Holliday junction branch migration protein RuvA [Erysipelotrichaceae bacterium]MBQ4252911.1 Holliday junction branch migration protein RuvA [Erysipelotrichaceae bacterium]MBQ7223506.1 Holliday junction branch migration protein RuvA [Erysipelotrichaceae bacterium]
MIYFLRGKVHSFGVSYVIIDVNGVGYYVNFCHQDLINLGQEVTLYTYQQFKEDDQLLFGFLERQEMEFFEKLISVKGLGPKTALNMLAHGNYKSLIDAIENGQIEALTRLPGLGAKISKQIILDLKGKLVESETGEKGKLNAELEEAVAGLKALGYKAYEINGILPQLQKLDKQSADKYLKEGLKLLLQRKAG